MIAKRDGHTERFAAKELLHVPFVATRESLVVTTRHGHHPAVHGELLEQLLVVCCHRHLDVCVCSRSSATRCSGVWLSGGVLLFSLAFGDKNQQINLPTLQM